MKSQMVTLKEEHDRAHREAEEYYSAVQRKLLEDQKLLKVSTWLHEFRTAGCLLVGCPPKVFYVPAGTCEYMSKPSQSYC